MPGMPKRRAKRIAAGLPVAPPPAPPPPPPPRLNALSNEMHARIVSLLTIGNYMETAAASAGVHPETVRLWLRRGAREAQLREQGIKNDDNSRYLIFWQDVTAAQANSEARIVGQLNTAVATDWRAGMELLARRFPKRWGPKVNVTVRDELDAALDRIEQLNLPHAILEKVLHALAGQTDTDPTGPGEGSAE